MLDDVKQVKTVLVVDDDPEVRRLIATMCAMDGYEVVGEAGNGIDAEALASQKKPRFVVLDFMMPYQDGAKTAKVLRKLLPDTRILAVSAVIHSTPEWADAFVDKSEIDSLTQTLDRLFATMG
jgi:DNA-binding NarL/FixJ family response regulator